LIPAAAVGGYGQGSNSPLQKQKARSSLESPGVVGTTNERRCYPALEPPAKRIRTDAPINGPSAARCAFARDSVS
jgi:hypothetical protein